MTSFPKLLLPMVAAALLFSCEQNKESNTEFQTTETGLQYKIFPASSKADTANKAEVGKIMFLHMTYDNGADSILLDTRKDGMPIAIQVRPEFKKGSIEDAFTMLTPGDSAVFKVIADSVFKHPTQGLPPYIKSGSLVTFRVKMDKILNEEQAQEEQKRLFEQKQKEMAANAVEQTKKDEETIKNYIKEKGLDAKRTESGLYYIITKPGTGPNAKAGQLVSVHYTGTTLDGQKFDSSVDRGEPIQFPLGQGQVIPGWDEGIALLNKGAKATFIIPSTLAYGPEQRGEIIKPNSILLFDVELVDIAQ